MTVKLTEGLINGAEPKCVTEFTGCECEVCPPTTARPDTNALHLHKLHLWNLIFHLDG